MILHSSHSQHTYGYVGCLLVLLRFNNCRHCGEARLFLVTVAEVGIECVSGRMERLVVVLLFLCKMAEKLAAHMS